LPSKHWVLEKKFGNVGSIRLCLGPDSISGQLPKTRKGH
jgi:hypothetical protein